MPIANSDFKDCLHVHIIHSDRQTSELHSSSLLGEGSLLVIHASRRQLVIMLYVVNRCVDVCCGSVCSLCHTCLFTTDSLKSESGCGSFGDHALQTSVRAMHGQSWTGEPAICSIVPTQTPKHLRQSDLGSSSQRPSRFSLPWRRAFVVLSFSALELGVGPRIAVRDTGRDSSFVLGSSAEAGLLSRFASQKFVLGVGVGLLVSEDAVVGRSAYCQLMKSLNLSYPECPVGGCTYKPSTQKLPNSPSKSLRILSSLNPRTRKSAI